RSAAAPCRRSWGAPRPSAMISISRHWMSPMPEPRALATASLAAQRAASEWARPPQCTCSRGVNTLSRKRGPKRSRASSMRLISIESTPQASMRCACRSALRRPGHGEDGAACIEVGTAHAAYLLCRYGVDQVVDLKQVIEAQIVVEHVE